ncbi:Zinc finger, CCHC-type [Corchorus capsularis]|uniref:Zinc finger, CCHC-type n=1 Tax=Corchorus capsularis TaxID=210143 RepID=A0A1R3GVY6_COCAP|nr:Zinc finger, CCHC-type [Corchorus capsularis]
MKEIFLFFSGIGSRENGIWIRKKALSCLSFGMLSWPDNSSDEEDEDGDLEDEEVDAEEKIFLSDRFATFLPHDDEKLIWISFKRERRVFICRKCGKPGHPKFKCNLPTDEAHGYGNLPYKFSRLFGPTRAVDAFLGRHKKMITFVYPHKLKQSGTMGDKGDGENQADLATMMQTIMQRMDALTNQVHQIREGQNQQVQPPQQRRQLSGPLDRLREQEAGGQAYLDNLRPRRGGERDESKDNIKYEIPKFNGRGIPEDYLDWESKLEMYFDYHPYVESKKAEGQVKRGISAKKGFSSSSSSWKTPYKKEERKEKESAKKEFVSPKTESKGSSSSSSSKPRFKCFMCQGFGHYARDSVNKKVMYFNEHGELLSEEEDLTLDYSGDGDDERDDYEDAIFYFIFLLIRI